MYGIGLNMILIILILMDMKLFIGMKVIKDGYGLMLKKHGLFVGNVK
jgi:hypothetical protein